MNEQLWWYIARSTGIVAWALLAASVVWGLALSTKITNGRPRPNWLLDLHRFLGGLALVFTGVHMGALVLDSYVDFGLTDLLVPMASSWQPGAVAWGVAGFYLLLAVEITSLLRPRLPRRVWKWTHMLSFPLFAASTAHGLLAGTDATGGPLFIAMLAASALVFALTVARIDRAAAQGRQAARREALTQSTRPTLTH